MSLRLAAQACLANRQLHRLSNAFIYQESGEENLRQLVQEDEAQRGRATARNTSKLPLDGLLVALKDNICTKRFPTTCASGMLKDYVSPFDATVVQLLEGAGAVLAGKTNMDEFGMGFVNYKPRYERVTDIGLSSSHSTYSCFGPVKNLIGNDVEHARSAGGSSGGSALAVATGQCSA